MSPRARWTAIGALCAALGPAATGCCAHGEAAPGPARAAAPEVKATVVRAAEQCGVQTAAPWVRWISEPGMWRKAFPPALLAAAPPPTDVDFATEALVLVGTGQRPTAGHAVELVSPAARLDGSTAVLRVALRTPAPGLLTAQVVTSPCLAVKLPRAGLDEVRVEDEAGTVLGSASLR